MALNLLHPPPVRAIVKWTAVFAVVAVLLGALFVWSGVYSVAASRGHWAVTEWLLTAVMRNSVKTHSYGIEAPAFDDDLVRLGAGHFHSGCAYCHSAPGAPVTPIARAMLPPPPDLATQMRPWRDRELFWIVKNGIKYTGMPGWAAQTRDDEVWALVAFMRRLPQLDVATYAGLALGNVTPPAQNGAQLATQEDATEATAACARCHGDANSGPQSKLVPVLHGQPEEFLIAALQAYADGTRASGIMQPIASDRTHEERAKIARYYAGLKPLRADATSADRGDGKTLAERGTSTIPACNGCHSSEALKVFPRLDGQNARYSANRLRLWKNGLAPGTPGEAIMAPIARMLSDQQIDDVTAYYASLNAQPQASAR